MAEPLYREYLLDADNFNKPMVLEDKQAIAALLTRLILLEPGTNPLFPTMGVGLVSKYRYLFKDAEPKLKEDIRNQIATFLPEADCTNVNLVYNDLKLTCGIRRSRLNNIVTGDDDVIRNVYYFDNYHIFKYEK